MVWPATSNSKANVMLFYSSNKQRIIVIRIIVWFTANKPNHEMIDTCYCYWRKRIKCIKVSITNLKMGQVKVGKVTLNKRP